MNLAIALPAMTTELQLSKSEAGLIGSCFYWSYAIGQLINGYLGDRVDSRRFVFIGLCVSATANILMGQVTSLVALSVIWATNGLALSTLWGPIVKTLSQWFSQGQRSYVAAGISTSIVGGYLVAWGPVGVLISKVQWQWAFTLPGIILLGVALVWLKLPTKPDSSFTAVDEVLPGNTSTLRILASPVLLLIASVCVAQGIVKDSISLWTPTLLTDIYHLKNATAFSLAIPVLSLPIILYSGKLYKTFAGREGLSIVFFLALASVSSLCLSLFLHANVAATSALLALTSASAYGANTLLLTVVPMDFARYGMVSGVAGFLDFSSYFGAAIAGISTGWVVDSFGWKSVAITWSLILLIGAVLMTLSQSQKRRVTANEV